MNKHKDFIIFLIIAIVLIGVVIFVKMKSASSVHVPASTKLQVTTSFYPLYFFATQVAGARANVINIIPAGTEPHDYEPSAQDIITMENSKLLILNGGGLEAWGDKIGQTLTPGRTLIVTTGKDLTTQTLAEGGKSVADPHVWLSPILAKKIVEKIVEGFATVDPDNALYYEMNAQALLLKLSDLDTLYRNGLMACRGTSIVTSHAAFGYLAAAYNFTQISVAGLSPDAEPSPKQIGEIVAFAKNNNVKYIFFESLASPKLSETIAREVGAQTLVLDPIEGLSADVAATGGDYFTQMAKNLENLRTALDCQK